MLSTAKSGISYCPRRMKMARLPVLVLPFFAVVIVFATWLVTALIDQAHLRSAYQVWQENETFAAATLALLAAMYAARPVYLQVRAQSVQAALDLLHRTEHDTAACITTRNMLFDLRRASVRLAGEVDAYATAPSLTARDALDLKDALDVFVSISPRDFKAMAERPTSEEADNTKIVALCAVLAIAQKIAAGILSRQDEGTVAQDIVAQERDFISAKLAGLFGLSTEIAEDLERQEVEMRARAKQLRRAADEIMDGV